MTLKYRRDWRLFKSRRRSRSRRPCPKSMRVSLPQQFCDPEFKVTVEAKERAGAEDNCSDVGSFGLDELGLNWDAIED